MQEWVSVPQVQLSQEQFSQVQAVVFWVVMASLDSVIGVRRSGESGGS